VRSSPHDAASARWFDAARHAAVAASESATHERIPSSVLAASAARHTSVPGALAGSRSSNEHHARGGRVRPHPGLDHVESGRAQSAEGAHRVDDHGRHATSFGQPLREHAERVRLPGAALPDHDAGVRAFEVHADGAPRLPSAARYRPNRPRAGSSPPGPFLRWRAPSTSMAGDGRVTTEERSDEDLSRKPRPTRPMPDSAPLGSPLADLLDSDRFAADERAIEGLPVRLVVVAFVVGVATLSVLLSMVSG